MSPEDTDTVKFVYEGHQVEVKVTAAKWSKISIPAMLTPIAHNFFRARANIR